MALTLLALWLGQCLLWSCKLWTMNRKILYSDLPNWMLNPNPPWSRLEYCRILIQSTIIAGNFSCTPRKLPSYRLMTSTSTPNSWQLRPPNAAHWTAFNNCHALIEAWVLFHPFSFIFQFVLPADLISQPASKCSASLNTHSWKRICWFWCCCCSAFAHGTGF